MSPSSLIASPSLLGEKEFHGHWLMVRLSWGSIIAGCVVALSTHLLLTMLGIGLGLRVINLYTTDNPVLGFTAVAGIVWTISALISLWIGGWVAGRTSGKGYGNIGGLHGIVVWGVATVLSFTIFSGTIGLLAGGATAALGKIGATGTNGAALNALDTSARVTPFGLGDTLVNFLDEVAPLAGASGIAAEAANHPAINVPRARREVGEALYRYFTLRNSPSRGALVQSLVDFAGQTPDEANTTVKLWEMTYDKIKEDRDQVATQAKQMERESADRVAKALTIVASWTFLMFGVGAFAAAWGGRCGGQRARVFHTTVAIPSAPSF